MHAKAALMPLALQLAVWFLIERQERLSNDRFSMHEMQISQATPATPPLSPQLYPDPEAEKSIFLNVL